MTRSDYAPTSPHRSLGGLLASVDVDSPAWRAGIRAGETVATVGGIVPSDILDWQWLSEGEAVELTVADERGAQRQVTVTRDPGEPWGMGFESTLFDAVKTCRNACVFCFMSQLPKGLRPSLYLRDDDYRMSFLQGNFITLTNLSGDDVSRIVEQRLSPLFVSLHAVTPSVRQELVCAQRDDALARLDELLDEGIDVHVQIVLVPGVNDGAELDTTLTWLAQREGVLSVGIVPLGYTRHQSEFTCGYEEPLAAATVIQQVQGWQFAMRERDGVSWVHLADEFYLNARAPFPTEEFYDGFPQYENGIGLVRTFGTEAAALRDELQSSVRSLPAETESVSVVTGVMAATTLAGTLNALDAVGRVRLLVVPNSFFGGNVSVTGLLTGEDLARSLASDSERLMAPTAYLLPDIVFNADGLTLDGLTLSEIRERSRSDVRVVSCDAAGLLSGLIDVSLNPPSGL